MRLGPLGSPRTRNFSLRCCLRANNVRRRWVPLWAVKDLLADGALTAVPAAGTRLRIPMPARLSFYYGPMDCGKSTLALQIDHNQARQGRRGLLLTRYDRSQRPEITTRVGLSHAAIEVQDDTDLRQLVRDAWTGGRELDYLIVDEAGFLSPEHVDQLVELVDDWHVDVFCFGLATDFRSLLLPGAKRLFELADDLVRVHVEVLCCAGAGGRGG